MKKKLLLCLFCLFLLCGCQKEEEEAPVSNEEEETGPIITYEDVTVENLTDFLMISSYISTGMPDCSNPHDACTSRGYFKNYNLTPKYNNVEFENVEVSLELQMTCYTDKNYNKTNEVRVHLDDLVLTGDGSYDTGNADLLPFGNNQNCYFEKTSQIVPVKVNGKIKITEYPE